MLLILGIGFSLFDSSFLFSKDNFSSNSRVAYIFYQKTVLSFIAEEIKEEKVGKIFVDVSGEEIGIENSIDKSLSVEASGNIESIRRSSGYDEIVLCI